MLFSLLSSAFAFPEFCAQCWLTFAYFMLRYHIFFKGLSYFDYSILIYFVCLLANLILNVVTLFRQYSVISQDNMYQKWTQKSGFWQKLFQYIITLIGIVNFKFTHALWSGIRSFPFLESAQNLSFFNLPSGISVVITLAFVGNSIVLINTRT